MKDFIKETEPLKLSIYSYERSDVILTIFFSILDVCFIFYFILGLKTTNKKVIDLKNKIFKLLVIDFIMRLLYTKKYSSWSIYKEFFFTFMNTVQFYLIIAFIVLALDNKKNEVNDSFSLIGYYIFFLLTFNFGYIYFFYSIVKKIIILMQSLYFLNLIYKWYNYFCKTIIEIVKNFKGKTEKKDKLNLFILGSPQSCLFLFSFYFILKLISVFFKDPIKLIYINIILNIIKETSKYFLFFVCQVIVYQTNKIKLEDDEEKKKFSQSEENNSLTNK